MQTTIIKQESNQFIIELSDIQTFKDIKMIDVVRHCNNKFDFDLAASRSKVYYSMKVLDNGQNIESVDTMEGFYLNALTCNIATKQEADRNVVMMVKNAMTANNDNYTVGTMHMYLHSRKDCYNNKYVIRGLKGNCGSFKRSTSCSYFHRTLNHLMTPSVKRVFLILDFD